jgi:HPt (histidine-containing phosphotransfer) domain-containing protein
MNTDTFSAGRDLTLDPFWAGIISQADRGPHAASGGREADIVFEDDENAAPAAFNVARLLDDCQGDEAFCTMILQKFASRAADQLAALDRAAASRNAVELARQADTLCGIATNLSAGELVVSAARLQWQARAGAFDRVAPLLESVRTDVARCLQAIPDVLREIGRTRRVSRGTVATA